MVIDARRDHSLRVPRPDLSVTLGTPNACNDCHTAEGEDAAWAARAVRDWYGDKRPDDPHYAPALAAANRAHRTGSTCCERCCGAARLPTSSGPVRPSCSLTTRVTRLTLCVASSSTIPALVRSAALEAMSSDALQRSVAAVSGRLHDPVRLVRFAAAKRLVGDAAALVESRYRELLDAAIVEYREAQQLVLDRAAAHINLSMLSQQLGDDAAARKSLETAQRLEPYLSGVRDELARLVERTGDDASLVNRLREEEVELLTRDAKLLPGNSQPLYRKGMLLFLLDRPEETREAFEAACRIGPNSFDNWLALALICERQEAWDRALEALAQMHQLRPGDPAIAGILQRIRAAGGLETEQKE